MNGVTLIYPSSGEPTNTVSLPFPAHNQPIGWYSGQSLYRSPAGTPYTVDHTSKWFQVERTFESLTEQQAEDLVAFFETINYSQGQFLYQYTDSQSGDTLSVKTLLLEPPKETKLHRNLRDITLVMATDQHPDAISDGASGDVLGGGNGGGGSIGGSTPTDDTGPPLITSSLAANAIQGVAFSYTITADGEPTITFSVTGLPSGLSLSGSTISGTVATLGTYYVVLTATNGLGSNVQTLALTVITPPEVAPNITSTLTLTAYAGVPWSYQVTTDSGFTVTYSLAPVVLSGTNISSGGLVTGDFADTGTYSVPITVTNEYGSTTATLVVTVDEPTIVTGDWCYPSNAASSSPGAYQPAWSGLENVLGNSPTYTNTTPATVQNEQEGDADIWSTYTALASFSGFSFDVPDGATVTGLEVEITAYGSSSSDSVLLTIYPGLLDPARDGNYQIMLGTSSATLSTGELAALLSTGPDMPLPLSDINSSSFTVAVQGDVDGSSLQTVYLLMVRARVFYTLD